MGGRLYHKNQYMATYDIKISQLNPFPDPTQMVDFFPMVDSSSLTTYRASIADIAPLMTHSIHSDSSSLAVTASYAISSSYALSASNAISSSYALSASNASSASYSIGSGNTISASYAFTASYAVTASNTISASYAINSSNTVSASYAVTSSKSISASYACSSSNAVTASYALTASNTISASWATNALSSSVALTASYVQQTAQTYLPYPFIQGMLFVATNDDYINANLLGTNWQAGTYDMCPGFSNNQVGDNPALALSYSFTWDNINKAYVSPSSHGVYFPTFCSPTACIRMWCDNRGGGGNNWNMYGYFYVYFALSPTQVVTHSYSPVLHQNYAQPNFVVSAYRAAAGLNAIVQADTINTINLIFANPIIS